MASVWMWPWARLWPWLGPAAAARALSSNSSSASTTRQGAVSSSTKMTSGLSMSDGCDTVLVNNEQIYKKKNIVYVLYSAEVVSEDITVISSKTVNIHVYIQSHTYKHMCVRMNNRAIFG